MPALIEEFDDFFWSIPLKLSMQIIIFYFWRLISQFLKELSDRLLGPDMIPIFLTEISLQNLRSGWDKHTSETFDRLSLRTSLSPICLSAMRTWMLFHSALLFLKASIIHLMVPASLFQSACWSLHTTWGHGIPSSSSLHPMNTISG